MHKAMLKYDHVRYTNREIKVQTKPLEFPNNNQQLNTENVYCDGDGSCITVTG